MKRILDAIKLVGLRIAMCVIVAIGTIFIFLIPFAYNVIKYILTGKFDFFKVIEWWFDVTDEIFTQLK